MHRILFSLLVVLVASPLSAADITIPSLTVVSRSGKQTFTDITTDAHGRWHEKANGKAKPFGWHLYCYEQENGTRIVHLGQGNITAAIYTEKVGVFKRTWVCKPYKKHTPFILLVQ